MLSSGFVSFFPQKMSYLQSCVGCTCVFLLSERSFGNSNFRGRTAAVVLADYLYEEREMSNVFLTESIKMNVNNNYLYSTGFSSAIPNLT